MALLTSKVSTLKELEGLACAVVPRQVGALGIDTVGGARALVPRQVGAALGLDTVGGSRAVVPRHQIGALGLDTGGSARAVVPLQVGALGLDTVGGALAVPPPRQVGAALGLDTVVPRQVGALGLDTDVVPRDVRVLGLDTVGGGARDVVLGHVSALGFDTLTGGPRRRIQVLRMDSVADAPAFVAIIKEKAAVAGWVCNDLPFIEKTAGFATILAKLADEIIPNLKRNPADKATLRLLRGRGEAARRIRTNRRRIVEGTVIARLAATLSNRLDRLARALLSNKKGPGWLAERLDDLAAHVDRCLETPVPVPTVDE